MARSERNEVAVSAFQQANHRMHQAMLAQPPGDPDRDFVRGMIPHHEGTVDMARIALEHGRDPELKKLAQEIIAAQAEDIAIMCDGLKRYAE